MELATGRLRKLNSFPNKAVVLCLFLLDVYYESMILENNFWEKKKKNQLFFFLLTPGQAFWKVNPNNHLRLRLVPHSMTHVPTFSQHIVQAMLPLRFWNTVSNVHQGWNFSTPLGSVPPFEAGTAVDQPEVETMSTHLVYPLWFRNRMVMGCVMNVYGINRDDNVVHIPTPMIPFELFPQ